MFLNVLSEVNANCSWLLKNTRRLLKSCKLENRNLDVNARANDSSRNGLFVHEREGNVPIRTKIDMLSEVRCDSSVINKLLTA